MSQSNDKFKIMCVDQNVKESVTIVVGCKKIEILYSHNKTHNET